MSRWDKLSMKDKSDLIKLYVANGIFNLEEIKKDYNKFGGGGKKEAIVDLRGVRDDNSDLDGEEDTFEYKPPKVTDLVLKAANAVLSSKFVPKDKKERLLELAMRMTGGNADIETVNVISKYLKSKDGINTIKQTLLTNTPIKDIISKSNAPDNYTGFAFSNDFLDSDVVSFIEEHPNDKDFVEAYTTGGIPFESAGVFKVNDRDSTRLGRYKNYLDTNYKDRYVPTYQGHIDTISMDIVKDLNRKSYNKETHTIGLDSDYDLPFEFGDKKGTPGYYDAAGYNLEVVKGKDGKLYGRKSDVYDFLPEDFIKRWMEGGSHTHNIVKTLDKLGNPFIFRSPWFGVNNKTVPRGLLYDYYNSNKFDGGGPLDWVKDKVDQVDSYLSSSRLGKFLAGFDQMMRGGQQAQVPATPAPNDNSLTSTFVNTKPGLREEPALLSRVRPNDSKTREASEAIENDVAKRQMSLIRVADKKGHPSKEYAIPYIMEQEIKIPGVGRTTKNILDSIAVNATKAGIPLYEAIGLAAEETALGAAPNLSTAAWIKNFKEKHDRMPTKEEIRIRENKVMNSSYARSYGQIYPQFLINDHEWHARGWEESPKYKKELEGIKSPLQHGFTLYKMGLYNTGDENHTNKVKNKGKAILSTDVVKEWIENSKHAQTALKVK